MIAPTKKNSEKCQKPVHLCDEPDGKQAGLEEDFKGGAGRGSPVHQPGTMGKRERGVAHACSDAGRCGSPNDKVGPPCKHTRAAQLC